MNQSRIKSPHSLPSLLLHPLHSPRPARSLAVRGAESRAFDGGFAAARFRRAMRARASGGRGLLSAIGARGRRRRRGLGVMPDATSRQQMNDEKRDEMKRLLQHLNITFNVIFASHSYATPDTVLDHIKHIGRLFYDRVPLAHTRNAHKTRR